MRGLITATVLAELERRLGKPLCESFDRIAGTSTGGILSALAAKGLPAADFQKFYTERGPRIFKTGFLDLGWVGPKFDVRILNKELVELLGDDRLLHTKTGLMIASYDKLSRSAFFFKSYDPQVALFKLSDAATSTASAPYYFGHWAVALNRLGYQFVDGGLFCNVPTLAAYCDVLHEFPGEEVRVVSIGTGYPDACTLHTLPNGGLFSWAAAVLPVAMDGAADVVHHICQELVGDNYVDLDIAMSSDIAMDDVRPTTLAQLKNLGGQIVQSQAFEDAVTLLTK